MAYWAEMRLKKFSTASAVSCRSGRKPLDSMISSYHRVVAIHCSDTSKLRTTHASHVPRTYPHGSICPHGKHLRGMVWSRASLHACEGSQVSLITRAPSLFATRIFPRSFTATIASWTETLTGLADTQTHTGPRFDTLTYLLLARIFSASPIMASIMLKAMTALLFLVFTIGTASLPHSDTAVCPNFLANSGMHMLTFISSRTPAWSLASIATQSMATDFAV